MCVCRSQDAAVTLAHDLIVLGGPRARELGSMALSQNTAHYIQDMMRHNALVATSDYKCAGLILPCARQSLRGPAASDVRTSYR
jgi:hypothetical protein